MSTKTRVVIQRTQTLTYDLDGEVPQETAVQIVKARINAHYELGLKSDITSITSVGVDVVKE